MSKRKLVLEVMRLLGAELDEQTEKIVKLLEKKESISETDIAEKLEVKINSVRKLLYKLSELDLAHYTKEKHPEKKWWFVYFWTLDVDKIYDKYIRSLKRQIELKKEAIAETATFFTCHKCNKKYEYSDALSCNFRCIRCSWILKKIKDKVSHKKLEKEIKRIKEELENYS